MDSKKSIDATEYYIGIALLSVLIFWIVFYIVGDTLIKINSALSYEGAMWAILTGSLLIIFFYGPK